MGTVHRHLKGYLKTPAYRGPDLPDLREELNADRDAALSNPDSLTRSFIESLKR